VHARQISYFLAVVEHGGFGRAAAALQIAQPSLSQSVRTLERDMGADLFRRAQAVAARLGQPALEGVEVGGGSDGNFTAAAGVPTLDGLGAVGGGAHAEGEHVVLAAMPDRVVLLAELVRDLLRER